MIDSDFAESPGVNNEQALIANMVAYRQHPSNALNIGGVTPSTLFCKRYATASSVASSTHSFRASTWVCSVLPAPVSSESLSALMSF
ncbi:hypothetical protein V8E53_012619 [Lactarius tabidus]